MAPRIAARIASAEEEAQRKIVDINKETVTNIAATDFPGHWPGESHEWNIQKFKENLDVKIYQNDYDEASFSVIGVDASVANAFRRILISEVPTVGIETCYLMVFS
ncbi:DNA-directed RNA polymerase core subunit rpc40 [Ascosphaera atra]|nr:DNA-directed RNA polymerase core subunit rpc40 [Ascosphaera atra]